MYDEPKNPDVEIRICESCGRDFTVEPEMITHSAQEQFCSECLSPYLLDDED